MPSTTASRVRERKRKWMTLETHVLFEARTFVAVYAASEEPSTAAVTETEKQQQQHSKPAAKAASGDEFWLAELLDDVTEDMAEGDACARVTWLDQRENGFVYAYDDVVDVQAILCHVFLEDLGDDTFQLTAKSLARVERSLQRTKGEAVADDDDASDGEQPPKIKKSRKKGRRIQDDDGDAEDDSENDDDDGEMDVDGDDKPRRTKVTRSRSAGGKRGSGRRGAGSTDKPRKLTKRELAMHVQPAFATVDLTKHVDREFAGTHEYEVFNNDAYLANNEVMRAVLTQNNEMLRKLVEDSTCHKNIVNSFSAPRSADVRLTPLRVAFIQDDVTAVGLLLKAQTIRNLAPRPTNSLPQHSTGFHTSAYSDYNRRAINASRGGKEGNNALLGDLDTASDWNKDKDFFWSCTNSSVKMQSVLYPTSQWTDEYKVAMNVARVARSGNFRLCSRLVGALKRNDGWGFNDLHCVVLSVDGAPLPQFREVSTGKQAVDSKLRPIHLAAINPDVKYLEALWEAGGDEWADAKDANGFELIHFAAACEGPAPIKFLLAQGCNLSAQTKTKQTALIRAITLRREDNAICILDHVRGQSTELLQKVLSERGPDSSQALHYAARSGCTHVLERLLDLGADINGTGEHKMTALCVAAQQGHLECVQKLLQRGAKVGASDKLNKTPLIHATKNGHAQIAALLINHGANINAYDTSDNTVAHYAAAYGWKSCLQLLVEAGADLWVRNAWGFVPVICALLKQLQVFKESGSTSVPVGQGLSPNVGNANNEMPLDVLISRTAHDDDISFYVDAARLLLQRGAKAEYVDDEEPKCQPLHLAITHNLKPIFDMLLTEFGVKVDRQGEDGCTAWEIAASKGNLGTAFLKTLLAQTPADINLQPRTGRAGNNFFHFVAWSQSGFVDVAVVQECIRRCSNGPQLVASRNSKGVTPLHRLLQCNWQCVSNKRTKDDLRQLIELFAQYSTDPALHVTSFATTLHYAAQAEVPSPDQDLVSLLFKYVAFDEATINAPDQSLQTPLGYAVHAGNEVATKILLAHGADPNHSPVRCAACSEDEKQCKCSRPLIDTPLCVAVRNNNQGLVTLLLSHGARVDCIMKSDQTEDRAGASCRSTNGFCFGSTGVFGGFGSPTSQNEQSSEPVEDIDDTPLHFAMKTNNGDVTELLLQHGADVTKPNATGTSPLQAAIAAKHSIPHREAHEGEVKYTGSNDTATSNSTPAILVALKSDKAKLAIIQKDEQGRTPIHHAAANRDLPLLEALLACTEDKVTAVNVPDNLGRTALHFAVNAASIDPNAFFDVERFLLMCGANVNAVDRFNFTALHFSVVKVNLNWQQEYDEKLGESQVKQDHESGDYENKMRAAFRAVLQDIPTTATDPVETVANLVAVRGADATVCDMLGRSPIHLAAATGAFVCLSTMIKSIPAGHERAKALELHDEKGRTPLGLAVLHLHQPTIMTLIESHADISVRIQTDDTSGTEDGITSFSLFYHAVRHLLAGICHMLLNANFPRRFALEDALLCNQYQLVWNLLTSIEVSNNPALVNSSSDDGDTLLHSLARINKSFDKLPRQVAWELVDTGVNVCHKNAKGNTALHFACANGNIHLMDFLLHNGADMNQVNAEGETPLVYAIKQSNCQINELLGAVDYFLSQPGLDVNVADHWGMNILSALVDVVAGKVEHIVDLFSRLEKILQRGCDPNRLFVSQSKKDLFDNDIVGTSVGQKMPLLIRALYFPSPSRRRSTLALLLRYGAKLTVTDDTSHTCLMHVVMQNMIEECKLTLGQVTTVNEWTSKSPPAPAKLSVPQADILAALKQANKRGQTALHLAVKPRGYVSFENSELLELLISAGGILTTKDVDGRTVVDYTRDQASRFLFGYLAKHHPDAVKLTEAEAFETDIEMFAASPDVDHDSAAYLEECEATGKITRIRNAVRVHHSCDVGKRSHVYALANAEGELIPGEEYNALLTKVDVKNGRFGLNVFYRLQLVHDEIQDLFVLFTNWGRVGESGKYQNTPFRTATEGVTEFHKVFKSKTGNEWKNRAAFEKKRGRYNLINRVDSRTKIDESITCSFAETKQELLHSLTRPYASATKDMLTAITDISNLNLAARELNYSGELPLAKPDELKAAIEKLRIVRAITAQRDELDAKMKTLHTDISDESASTLTQLSEKHADLTEEVSQQSSRYYEIMPCDESKIGSSIKAFETTKDVDKEIHRVRTLLDIAQTYKILLGAKRHQLEVNPLEYCHDAMQVNVDPVALDSDEGDLLSRYFYNGIRPSERSQYRVSNIFSVQRQGELERFNTFIAENASYQEKHTTLLWHGTRRTNLMVILSQGLRIAPPEAPHQGYAYGKGLYFADVAAKSIGYCNGCYDMSTETTDEAGNKVENSRYVRYLLLCEVALGSTTDAFEQAQWKEIPAGIESVRARGRHYPAPDNEVVSPASGARLPMGKVGQDGIDFPMSSMWVLSANSTEASYENRIHYLGDEALVYLDKLAVDMKVGEEFIFDSSSHFKLFLNRDRDQKRLRVEREAPEARVWDAVPTYDCVFKLTVLGDDDAELNAVRVTRWRNVMEKAADEVVGENDQVQRHHRWLQKHNEFIVYNERQVRIRYLVEVESDHDRWW